MAEKPIIFCGAMVRRIIADQKSMTRRLLRYQPTFARLAPYAVGDRLWVKETHAWADLMAEGVEREDPVCVAYRADQTAISHEADNRHYLDTTVWNWDRFKWRPSIFMPRWASRLTLEVTAVRVERLQDITEADILAEGAVERDHYGCPVSTFDGKAYMDLRSLWAAGWNGINADRAAWETNPWVVALTFKRNHAGEAQPQPRGA